MASLIKRGKVYYAQYMVGKRAKRISLDTTSLQLAKEKVRQLESSLYRGGDNPLPSKTPVADVVTDYIEYMRTRRPPGVVSGISTIFVKHSARSVPPSLSKIQKSA